MAPDFSGGGGGLASEACSLLRALLATVGRERMAGGMQRRQLQPPGLAVSQGLPLSAAASHPWRSELGEQVAGPRLWPAAGPGVPGLHFCSAVLCRPGLSAEPQLL